MPAKKQVTRARPKIKRQAQAPAANQAIAVLVELMNSAASEQVRASAAKTLLEKVWPMNGEPDTSQAEREAAIRAIMGLLDDIAVAQSGRHAGQAKVVAGSTPQPADAKPSAGSDDLANLAHPRRTRLG
jgi:hypothetical protein